MSMIALIVAATMASTTWQRLPDLPDREGFAGMFAGVSGGPLIVAGGANFPDKKPWESGKKVWYDRVYVLDRRDGEWKDAGRLPRPIGYGVSATHGSRVICVGGSDADRHYADAFALEWRDGKLITTELPPLPKAVANACGTIIGQKLYVTGGQDSPAARDALATLYELDLAAERPAWRELEPCPGGGRILATAAAAGDDLYIIGGAALTPERRYLTDAWRYTPGRGWTRVADLPHPVVATPSPAPTDVRGVFVLGGDDGTQVGVTPPQGHKGFAKTILFFDIAANAWRTIGEIPEPRVTAPCVRWNDAWVIPSGERVPGIRSPQVWSFTPKAGR
jgi:N-acetylneuraminic acid mutarotase